MRKMVIGAIEAQVEHHARTGRLALATPTKERPPRPRPPEARGRCGPSPCSTARCRSCGSGPCPRGRRVMPVARPASVSIRSTSTSVSISTPSSSASRVSAAGTARVPPIGYPDALAQLHLRDPRTGRRARPSGEEPTYWMKCSSICATRGSRTSRAICPATVRGIRRARTSRRVSSVMFCLRSMVSRQVLQPISRRRNLSLTSDSRAATAHEPLESLGGVPGDSLAISAPAGFGIVAKVEHGANRRRSTAIADRGGAGRGSRTGSARPPWNTRSSTRGHGQDRRPHVEAVAVIVMHRCLAAEPGVAFQAA